MRIFVLLVVVFTSSSAFAERHQATGQHASVVHAHTPQIHVPQEHFSQAPVAHLAPQEVHRLEEPRVRVIEIAPSALCADGIYAYSADPDDFCASHSGISYYFSW